MRTVKHETFIGRIMRLYGWDPLKPGFMVTWRLPDGGRFFIMAQD